MFKENVLSGLSWVPLISRIVWAKNPQNPRDVVPLTPVLHVCGSRSDWFILLLASAVIDYSN